MAVGELAVIEEFGGDRDVLFFSFGIGKTEIDEFDLVFLDHLEDVAANCHGSLLRGG